MSCEALLLSHSWLSIRDACRLFENTFWRNVVGNLYGPINFGVLNVSLTEYQTHVISFEQDIGPLFYRAHLFLHELLLQDKEHAQREPSRRHLMLENKKYLLECANTCYTNYLFSLFFRKYMLDVPVDKSLPEATLAHLVDSILRSHDHRTVKAAMIGLSYYAVDHGKRVFTRTLRLILRDSFTLGAARFCYAIRCIPGDAVYRWKEITKPVSYRLICVILAMQMTSKVKESILQILINVLEKIAREHVKGDLLNLFSFLRTPDGILAFK